jgi:hypothetical protein
MSLGLLASPEDNRSPEKQPNGFYVKFIGRFDSNFASWSIKPMGRSEYTRCQNRYFASQQPLSMRDCRHAAAVTLLLTGYSQKTRLKRPDRRPIETTARFGVALLPRFPDQSRPIFLFLDRRTTVTIHWYPKATDSSRRSFLRHTTTAGFGMAATIPLADSAFAETPALAEPNKADDDEFYAIFSDTHISQNRGELVRGIRMAENLATVVQEVLAEPTLPSGVIINGDCAYLQGFTEDYAVLRDLLQPLVDAGIPIHCTLGNHDDRSNFYRGLSETAERTKPSEQVVLGKHAAIVSSSNKKLPKIYLLDSLDVVNNVTGRLGKDQLTWLADSLAEYSDQPAIVFGHHNPLDPPADSAVNSGLADTGPLFETLAAAGNVSVYAYGHTHTWLKAEDRQNIPLVNLPPVAYVFAEDQPSGWVRMRMTPETVSFELVCREQTHPSSGERFVIKNRETIANG